MYIFLKFLQKVVRVSVPSSTPEVSIHQSKLHSPAGQSAFSPLVQQFSNLEPQVIYFFGVINNIINCYIQIK